jgi:para-aminobenzoate synthetase component 1
MQTRPGDLTRVRPEFHEVAAPPSPREVFERVGANPHAAWLDSASPDGAIGRYSFVAWRPFAVLRASEGSTEWVDGAGARQSDRPVTDELDEALERWRVDASGMPVPFCGGCIGFLGYELAGQFERLPRNRHRDIELPDCELAFYDVVVGWDHETDRCFVVSTGRPADGRDRERRAVSRLEETIEELRGGSPYATADLEASRLKSDGLEVPGGSPLPGQPWLSSTTTESEYRDIVARAIDYIADGDVYQVNLSQRFEAAVTRAPLELYLELRQRNAAPYAAALRSDGTWILSSSPERFLRIDADGQVETRPIKGTRSRSSDLLEDRRLADELRASGKDRAENLMIVDLLRNDLSRVCVPGTVRVPDLFRLESWSTVHHLVSTVTGRLRPDVTVGQVLRATFPSGSVTGAPKIRAMEIIDELESVERGPYCGAIGYMSFDGQVDLAVAIRVVSVANGRATYHAGGGVVYDSDPKDEYVETLHKARAITAAVAGDRPVLVDG